MRELPVKNCRLFDLPKLGDARGGLVALQAPIIPFEIKRVYYLYGTDIAAERGFHAHRALLQVAICVSGRLSMVVDDGARRHEVS